jgi:hypothetical protein
MTQRSSRLRPIGAIAAGAALIGTLCPWISTPLFTRSGISTGDGKILAVLAVVALIAGPLVGGRRLGVVYLACGAIGAAASWYDLFHVAHRIHALGTGPLAATVSTGIGLYLDVAATTVMTICGLALTLRKP